MSTIDRSIITIYNSPLQLRVSVITHLALNLLLVHTTINLGFVPSLGPLVELAGVLVDGTPLQSTQVVDECLLADEVLPDGQDRLG